MTSHELEKNVVWTGIRNDIHRIWGRVSREELDATGGDMEEVDSLIQQKYSDTLNNYKGRLSNIYKKHVKSGRLKMDVSLFV